MLCGKKCINFNDEIYQESNHIYTTYMIIFEATCYLGYVASGVKVQILNVFTEFLPIYSTKSISTITKTLSLLTDLGVLINNKLNRPVMIKTQRSIITY